MRAIVFAIALALLPASALAATIASKDARAHLGQTVTVEGVVSGVHTARSGGVTFLDIDGYYPNNAFTAVIFASDLSKFTNIQSWAGAKVDITGVVKDYKGKTEIVLSAPAQIRRAQ